MPFSLCSPFCFHKRHQKFLFRKNSKLQQIPRQPRGPILCVDGIALKRQRTCFTHMYTQLRGTGRTRTRLPADHMSSTTVSPAPGTQYVPSKWLMNETPIHHASGIPPGCGPQAWEPSCTALMPKPSSASTEASVPQKRTQSRMAPMLPAPLCGPRQHVVPNLATRS